MDGVPIAAASMSIRCPCITMGNWEWGMGNEQHADCSGGVYADTLPVHYNGELGMGNEQHADCSGGVYAATPPHIAMRSEE